SEAARACRQRPPRHRDGRIRIQGAKYSFKLEVLLLLNHIDLAVKSVAEIVVSLRAGHVKQKVAVFADRAVRIGDAHTVLAAVFPAFGPRIDLGDQFPAAFLRVSSRLWFRIETLGGAVAAVHFIDLRPARAGMPGIGVDLLDGDGLVETDFEPSTFGAGIKKEVLRRFVLLAGKFAVVEFGDVATSGVLLAVHDSERSLGRRVILGRRGHILEFEGTGGVTVLAMIDGHLDLRSC